MNILELDELTKKFGGLTANDRISFNIEKGTIFGIIGPNGAGKTVLFNTISGIYAPDSGRVVFNGEDITNKPSYTVCKKGIGRTFQIPMSLNTMTVLDNAIVGTMVHTPKTQEARNYALEILEFVGLSNEKDRLAGSLSVIQKKRLEIARALSTKPTLLMLDECMAGLHGDEREKAIELIKKINKNGITILMIEHVMEVVMGVCQKLLVLQYGKKIAEGKPNEVINNPLVISAYLGGKDNDA